MAGYRFRRGFRVFCRYPCGTPGSFRRPAHARLRRKFRPGAFCICSRPAGRPRLRQFVPRGRREVQPACPLRDSLGHNPYDCCHTAFRYKCRQRSGRDVRGYDKHSGARCCAADAALARAARQCARPGHGSNLSDRCGRRDTRAFAGTPTVVEVRYGRRATVAGRRAVYSLVLGLQSRNRGQDACRDSHARALQVRGVAPVATERCCPTGPPSCLRATGFWS